MVGGGGDIIFDLEWDSNIPKIIEASLFVGSINEASDPIHRYLLFIYSLFTVI